MSGAIFILRWSCYYQEYELSVLEKWSVIIVSLVIPCEYGEFDYTLWVQCQNRLPPAPPHPLVSGTFENSRQFPPPWKTAALREFFFTQKSCRPVKLLEINVWIKVRWFWTKMSNFGGQNWTKLAQVVHPKNSIGKRCRLVCCFIQKRRGIRDRERGKGEPRKRKMEPRTRNNN